MQTIEVTIKELAQYHRPEDEFSGMDEEVTTYLERLAEAKGYSRATHEIKIIS